MALYWSLPPGPVSLAWKAAGAQLLPPCRAFLHGWVTQCGGSERTVVRVGLEEGGEAVTRGPGLGSAVTADGQASCLPASSSLSSSSTALSCVCVEPCPPVSSLESLIFSILGKLQLGLLVLSLPWHRVCICG